MATPKQILNELLNPKLSGTVFINISFTGNPFYTPLKGFYKNSVDEGAIYFYGDDKLGFSFNAHYNRIFIKDFLGRYRRCILRTEDEFILQLLPKQKEELFTLYLEADEILPGDICGIGHAQVIEKPHNNQLRVYANEELMPYTIEMAPGDAKRFCYTLIRASDGSSR